MIHPNYILALSDRSFVSRQLQAVFCGRGGDLRRDGAWNGWGLDRAFDADR